jgi:Protein of unknown function (DUF995)
MSLSVSERSVFVDREAWLSCPLGEAPRTAKTRFWRPRIGALAIAIATMCLSGNALAAKLAKHWAPLGASAVNALYAGKTWRWKQGAAFFSPDGRFKAWSREGGKLTEGRGAWDLRGDGVMCFTATWETVPDTAGHGPSRPVETCFDHEARGAAIAQMKLPDGRWYFFKHAPPQQTDEFFKLEAGDRTRLSN